MNLNSKYRFVEKKLFNLWKLDKELYVLYDYSNSEHKELLKIKCVLDERKEKYFYFEKLDYMFNRRLFNKNKWLVMTKDYKTRDKTIIKTHTIDDLIEIGRIKLKEAVTISKTLKEFGYEVPILENLKLKEGVKNSNN